MKKLGLLLIFFSLNSAAEFQSPEDLVTPDKPITVIFKNLTRHESVMRVVQAIDDSRVVRPFHMVRAARSLIFYCVIAKISYCIYSCKDKFKRNSDFPATANGQ